VAIATLFFACHFDSRFIAGDLQKNLWDFVCCL
jgi:hypothetical protein